MWDTLYIMAYKVTGKHQYTQSIGLMHLAKYVGKSLTVLEKRILWKYSIDMSLYQIPIFWLLMKWLFYLKCWNYKVVIFKGDVDILKSLKLDWPTSMLNASGLYYLQIAESHTITNLLHMLTHPKKWTN